MKRAAILITLVGLLFGTLAASAVADDEKLTGLDRARQATLQGLEKSQGKAAEAPGQVNRAKGLRDKGEKLTGHERAAAALGDAIDRGNGKGNAFGRGNAAYVHEILAGGGIPGQMKDGNHGQRVKELVHAYNEMRKAGDDS
jgi:hypothetical protein